MTQAIQAKIQSILATVDGFDSQTVSLGDFKILDRGTPPYGVILPGGVKINNVTVRGTKIFEWTYYIEFFARFLDDNYEPLITARQAILDKLPAYHKLGGLSGVKSFDVTELGEVDYVYPKNSREVPHFVMQRITTVTLTDTVFAGIGDYP